MSDKISGVLTALVTPFHKNKVDFPSLESLVKAQLKNGVSGFVVNGTTAESPTLEQSEVQEIFQCVKNLSKDTTPLILGIGTNCTRTTIAWAERASAWGADAALAVVPYYNKPPQRGLYGHFKSVAESSDVPILLYNVPSRTITNLELETIVALSRIPKIIGIKESTGNLELMMHIRAQTDPEFLLLSGDDETSVDFCARGGNGVISVCSHIMPKEMNQFIDRARAKDLSAVEEFKKYQMLVRSLYTEANPIPVKKAAQILGLIRSAEMRPPLAELHERFEGELRACLKILSV